MQHSITTTWSRVSSCKLHRYEAPSKSPDITMNSTELVGWQWVASPKEDFPQAIKQIRKLTAESSPQPSSRSCIIHDISLSPKLPHTAATHLFVAPPKVPKAAYGIYKTTLTRGILHQPPGSPSSDISNHATFFASQISFLNSLSYFSDPILLVCEYEHPFHHRYDPFDCVDFWSQTHKTDHSYLPSSKRWARSLAVPLRSALSLQRCRRARASIWKTHFRRA